VESVKRPSGVCPSVCLSVAWQQQRDASDDREPASSVRFGPTVRYTCRLFAERCAVAVSAWTVRFRGSALDGLSYQIRVALVVNSAQMASPIGGVPVGRRTAVTTHPSRPAVYIAPIKANESVPSFEQFRGTSPLTSPVTYQTRSIGRLSGGRSTGQLGVSDGQIADRVTAIQRLSTYNLRPYGAIQICLLLLLLLLRTTEPSVLRCYWLGGRKGIPHVKTEWWGAGVVICLEQGADLHMSQLMPLPLNVSCFSKIQIGFTFLVLAHLGSPGKRAVKRVCVCVC